jgi:hypothetical protein
VASGDAIAPPWGPGFLRLNSWVYRAEYGAATVAILFVLFVWRGFLLGDLPWSSILLVVFWAVWPDLAAFIPIGVASRGGRSWPAWGPALYNSVHNLLLWGAIFVLWSLLAGQVEWPLLAWAGHITADRASGYYLRSPAVVPPTVL